MKYITLAVSLFAGSVAFATTSIQRRNMNMIEIAMANVPARIDPLELWNFQHFLLVNSVFQTLVRVAESGRIVSDLAERWEVFDDGTTYVFHLNPKSVFHDGKNVTSKDVIYSLSRHFWKDSTSVVKEHLQGIVVGTDKVTHGKTLAGLTATDNTTVKIKLTKPYAPFLKVLASPTFAVVPAGATGDGVSVGSGPMKISKHSAKEWELVASETYSGTRQQTKSIRISEVNDPEVVNNMMKNDKVDVFIGLMPAQVDGLQIEKNYQVTRTNSLCYNHMFFNTKKPILTNQEFRQDLAAQIQEYTKQTKTLPPQFSYEPFFIPKGVMPHDYYERTPALADADNFKKKWGSHVKGKPIRLVLRPGYYSEAYLSSLVAHLKNLGVEIAIQYMQNSEYIKTLSSNDYDIVVAGYLGTFPDPDGFIEPLKGSGGLKYGNFDNGKLFAEISKIRFVSPPAARLEAYSKTMKTFENEWNLVPLHRLNLPVVHNSSIQIPDTSYKYEAELWNFKWMK